MGETETETEALTSILNKTIIFAFMQFFRMSLICQETKKNLRIISCHFVCHPKKYFMFNCNIIIYQFISYATSKKCKQV